MARVNLTLSAKPKRELPGAAEHDPVIAAPGSDQAPHKSIVPESLKLLFLDPPPGF